MLRITQKTSETATVQYFFGYYSEKELGKPVWRGKGSKILGLKGVISQKDFEAICNNLHHKTGEQITGRMSAKRIVAYDMTFSVPKSLSIVHAITNDEDILNSFNIAVIKAMEEMENGMQVRVRINGANENRTVGNMIYGVFTHGESRPVNGITDPQLHKHVMVPNLVYDNVEEKWKAGKFRNVKANAPYYETYFRSVLADELTKVGYSIERTKGDFEIKGFGRELIDKFSRRTEQIEERAIQLGITNSEDKAHLGATTRAEKLSNPDRNEVIKEWKSRLTNDEFSLIESAKDSSDNVIVAITPNQAIDYSLSHLFERKSVVTEKELITCALKRSYAHVDPDRLKEVIYERNDLLSREEKDGDTLFTTYEALNEEKKLIQSSKNGMGILHPINEDYLIQNDGLTDEQANAVHHSLNSRDFITAISGKAGVGKTYCIKEVANAVTGAGLPFIAVAPSAEASRGVQRNEGFSNATTVADLLQNDELQANMSNGVLWVDEASLLGNQSMNDIISIAAKQNTRLLLTGDIFQHNSPERGDAYRILQEYGGVIPANINYIQRQKTDEYRDAVKLISNNQIIQGLDKLDDMGAIHETENFEELLNNSANEYVESIRKNEHTLIVSTTHRQGKAITAKVRKKLKEEGLISSERQPINIYSNLNFTNAEKSDVLNYSEGQVIQFHQNIKSGIIRGSKYMVVKAEEKFGVEILNINPHELDKVVIKLPLDLGNRFSVYHQSEISLAIGDIIRIKQNGFSIDKKRLNNGNILKIKGFDKQGNILASTGKREITLDKNFGNFDYGYYSTSPASQGKSINKVIIVQSSLSGKASSKEQFYVSSSRGKFSISIHTDDKEYLFKSVQRSAQRMTASELVAGTKQENHDKSNNPKTSVQSRVERLKKIELFDKLKTTANRGNNHDQSRFT